MRVEGPCLARRGSRYLTPLGRRCSSRCPPPSRMISYPRSSPPHSGGWVPGNAAVKLEGKTHAKSGKTTQDEQSSGSHSSRTQNQEPGKQPPTPCRPSLFDTTGSPLLFTLPLKKKSFNLKLSGNEAYCTNALLSLIKIMLCGKLQCKKVLN